MLGDDTSKSKESSIRTKHLCVLIHIRNKGGVAIILERKRKLVALLFLSYRCTVSINVLWLFLTVPWVGLQCAIVVFLDHTPHLLLDSD